MLCISIAFFVVASTVPTASPCSTVQPSEITTRKQGSTEDFFQLQCQTPKLLLVQAEVVGAIQQENSTLATKEFNRNEILYSCLYI